MPAALWLSLLTVLLSAPLPAGLPRTSIVGSAFNPATVTEALRSSSLHNRDTVQRVAKNDRDAATLAKLKPGGDAGWLVMSSLADSQPQVQIDQPRPIAELVRPADVVGRANRARAPPAF